MIFFQTCSNPKCNTIRKIPNFFSPLIIVAAIISICEMFQPEFGNLTIGPPTDISFGLKIVIAICVFVWMTATFWFDLKNDLKFPGFQIKFPKYSQHIDIFTLLLGVFAIFALFTEVAFQFYIFVSNYRTFQDLPNWQFTLTLNLFLLVGTGLYLTNLICSLTSLTKSKIYISLIVLLGLILLSYIFIDFFVYYFYNENLFRQFMSWGSNNNFLHEPFKAIFTFSGFSFIIPICMLAVLIALMLIGIPMGMITLSISIFTAILYLGPSGLELVTSKISSELETNFLIATPFLFLIAFTFKNTTIVSEAWEFLSFFAKRFHGGGIIQTVIIGFLLAIILGILGAEILLLSIFVLPKLIDANYNRSMSIGLICALGTLAVLVSPSILVQFLSEDININIRYLNLAGILPAIFLIITYSVYALIRIKINPKFAPKTTDVQKYNTLNRNIKLNELIVPGSLFTFFGFIIYGIYWRSLNIEIAAAIGCIGTLVIMLISKKITFKGISTITTETMIFSGALVWRFLGAFTFYNIFVIVGGSNFLKSILDIFSNEVLGITILAIIMILVFFGFFMEWILIVLLTKGTFAETIFLLAPKLNLTPDQGFIWFGILTALVIQIGLLTPPFATANLWLKKMYPRDIKLSEINRAVIPFIFIQITILIAVVLFPKLIFFLPELFLG